MKRMLFGRVFPLLLAAALLAGGVVGVSAAEKAIPIVSYGVGVLAADMDVAVSAMVGNPVEFSEEVFCRGLNLSRIRYITLESVPSVGAGELLLGSTRVVAGQTVTGENLAHMTFAAASEDIRQASFSFYVNGGGVPLICNMYLLAEENATPTVGMAPELSLAVSTYRGIATYGKLSAYDADGDSLRFEIVSYPKNGAVRMLESGDGSYVYTPSTGYVGRDSFSYVARDTYGNYSSAATVSLEISVAGTSVTYADMMHSDAYSEALRLTEAGIMSGTQVGSLYYFYPEENVSRAEFLVMAMNAAGITDPPACSETSFADDGEILPSMKGYVEMAYSLGYINGKTVDGELCFMPNAPINRAEAAVMLGNLVGLSDVAVTPVFADTSEIPVWARDAVYSLYSVGILNSRDGYIAPTATVTREQSAEMLAAVMAYVK